MEDVLGVYQPHDPSAPVVCMDESESSSPDSGSSPLQRQLLLALLALSHEKADSQDVSSLQPTWRLFLFLFLFLFLQPWHDTLTTPPLTG